jgi:hypothetical protein
VGEQQVALSGRKLGEGGPEGPAFFRIEDRFVGTAGRPAVVQVAFVPPVSCRRALLVADQVAGNDDGISGRGRAVQPPLRCQDAGHRLLNHVIDVVPVAEQCRRISSDGCVQVTKVRIAGLIVAVGEGASLWVGGD